ncbi:MAG TPA: type I polyketide synthase, partial [Thermoanaerobaculia bacterium]|nr:type I polyketide synthase [Thermoanaerobaculia bacterium]
VGSVKTNIGHLDAAAGVAGLIKTVLALTHRRLPPSLHFRRPNPKIGLDRTPFRVQAEAADWPANGVPRRAGVSSFGIGGTNAHAVLEEAPPRPPSGSSRDWQLLVVSARSETALEEATRRLAGHLRDHPEAPLADVAWTLQAGRRPWGLRRAVVCRDPEEGAALLEGAVPRRLLAGAPGNAPGPAAVFLFPGQGAQHPGMAAAVYRQEAVFREHLDRAAELLAPELGLDLRSVLFPERAGGEPAPEDEARLQETSLAQPALFAVEHALARLWQSWGVEPEAMLGHSVGELVAACLAGVIAFPDALAAVAARGRLMGAMPPGAMLAVALPEAEVLPLLDEAGEDFGVAAVNGPEAVVVSGPFEAVGALRERLAARGAGVRLLRTSHAFHSPSMDPAAGAFAARMEEVELRPPRIPFVSGVTGTWITAEEATDPAYWGRQLRAPVRFADGLGAVLATRDRVLLEVGPGRTLSTLARQHPARGAAREIAYSLPHPKAGEPDDAFLLATVGRIWAAGAEVDWHGFHRGEERRRVPLPTYPFQRRSYWVSRTGAGPLLAASASAADELPAAEAEAHLAGPGAVPGAAPRNDVERLVAALWQEMLGTERIGIHDEFFDLGGSSLLAVGLVARLRERLGVELDPHVLLEAPTVAELAGVLAGKLAAAGGDGQAEAPPRAA